MANEIGALLNGIGNLLALDTAYPLDGTFLYVEAGRGWVDMSIFKDLGDRLLWRDAPQGLAAALLELWEAEVPAKRWSAMQYRLNGGTFEASFTHELPDPELSTLGRRERILNRLFGNKQIVYPPLR